MNIVTCSTKIGSGEIQACFPASQTLDFSRLIFQTPLKGELKTQPALLRQIVTDRLLGR
jgi:hypothetical protein